MRQQTMQSLSCNLQLRILKADMNLRLSRDLIPRKGSHRNINKYPKTSEATISTIIILGMKSIQDSTEKEVGGLNHQGQPD